jgi:hypothetical protein
MFGEEFGLDYYQQRHAQLLQEVEQERLIRCLAASRRAERNWTQQTGLHKRALAAVGGQLVRLGQRMQQATPAVH